MRISSKGRYALSSMIYIAKQYGSVQNCTVVSIAEKLGISKIYLEQVFSLLKRAGLVISVKGSQGGYQLAYAPDKITLLDILKASELSMFEETEESVAVLASGIEAVMQENVWKNIDKVLENELSKIKLDFLAAEAKKKDYKETQMFYI